MESCRNSRDCENKRSEAYKDLSAMLARLELFCIGINKKIYDFDTFYAVAHKYFDNGTLYQRIEPLLEKRRSGTGGSCYEGIDTVLKKMHKQSMRWKTMRRNNNSNQEKR